MILAHDDSGDGDAVVLLHAAISDRRMWGAQVLRFGEEGYRVVTMDLPGFGDSPVATELDAPWLDVLETLDLLEIERAAFVGNSFGGAIALRVAAVAPERVTALALVSSPPVEIEPSAQLSAAWEAEEEALTDGDIDAATAAVVEAWLLPDASPAMREGITAMQSRAFELQLDQDPAPEPEDPAAAGPDAFASLEAPVLVMAGEHDMTDFAEGAEALAELLGAGDPVLIPGAGHLAPLEEPAAFEALILELLDR